MLWSQSTEKRTSNHRELVAKGALLVDVRTPEEFADGHVKGAKNIPVHEIPARLGDFGPSTRPVVLYCRSGARSASAAQFLRARGYEVVDVGGMYNW